MIDEWTIPNGNQSKLIFMGVASIDPAVAALLSDETPYDFNSAIIDDSVINGMVNQTNIYVTQKLLDRSDITPYS